MSAADAVSRRARKNQASVCHERGENRAAGLERAEGIFPKDVVVGACLCWKVRTIRLEVLPFSFASCRRKISVNFS
jgi:hypothetical protein